MGTRGTILTLGVSEASESEVASLPSIEVVGVNGGVARVTVGVTGCSGVDGWAVLDGGFDLGVSIRLKEPCEAN